MSVNIEIPNISGATEGEQLAQIKNYLIQLSGTLNWAFDTVDNHVGSFSSNAGANMTSLGVGGSVNKNTSGQSQFAQLKDLIIKSADFTQALSEEITKTLKGKYVAKSDFGTYQEITDTKLSASSEEIRAEFSNLQEIITADHAVNAETGEIEKDSIFVKATIRAGILEVDDEGRAIYGIEVGQEDYAQEGSNFKRFARFTASKITFYDAHGSELVWFSPTLTSVNKLHVRGDLQIGNKIMLCPTDDGLAVKWIG